ncbi:uncharacterized protein LOC110050777 [Orbicella faveolata]|uniref:uncharacterized protein LOC110050777 n=1 Tax=Orbicella faveolata TaxID=48498 RepID=UPI0009E5BD0C|nr:uncharacterized protein LOC110050777 [Orbicella faveolata]
MEKEKTSALDKIHEEAKELNTKEDVVSRGNTLRPSEPKERAKEPDNGNSGLSALRQGVIVNENSSHDDIQRSCQQLIDDINAKRKRDTDLLNGKVIVVYSSLSECRLYRF